MDHAPQEYADSASDAESYDGDLEVKPDPNSPSMGSSANRTIKPNYSLQKRRRVSRACDECRRKKIKCDGKQPCTHCTVYSYGM